MVWIPRVMITSCPGKSFLGLEVIEKVKKRLIGGCSINGVAVRN